MKIGGGGGSWLMSHAVTEKLFHFFGKSCHQLYLQNSLDITCVLIGLQVCFHSAMKHENGVSNVV